MGAPLCVVRPESREHDVKISSRTLRVIGATLGLIAAGALFGGVAASIAVVFWGMAIFGGTFDAVPAAMGFAFSTGAILGSFMGPLVAWGLLRRVPLGKAVLGATIGACVGGALTAFFPFPATHPLIGGAVGMLGSAVIMRARFAKKAKALSGSTDYDGNAELQDGDDAQRLLE